MASTEARFIRESAETTYKLRRRIQSIRKKQDDQKSGIQESSSETRQLNLQVTSAAPVQDARVEPNILFPTTAAQEQKHVHGVANIPYHYLPTSTVPISMDYVRWDSSLPSAHLALRSDMRLLMTFLDVIFPLQCGFYGLSGTTDRSWLLHTLVDTEPLYQASLSVTVSFEAGMRSGNLNGVSDLDPDARRLQIGALRGLQQYVDGLDTEIYYGKELLRRGMQALGIMTQLLSLEVFTFVEGQWEMHLQAARTILGMFQNKWAPELFAGKGIAPGASSIGEALTGRCSTDDLKALKFFITSFVWVDIIANATHGPPPFNPRHFNYLSLLKNGYLKPQEIMGCQSCIMVAITEITALEAWKRTQIERGCLSVVQLVTRAATLDDRLNLGIQGLESRLCINSTSLETDSEAVNLIFAYGALVYLHTIVSGASPHTPEIKHNVTRCLERLEVLPTRLLIRNCWPFTVAGCMATTDQYGRFRDIVTRTSAAKQALGTTWKGIKVMEECWRLRKFEPGMWCWTSTMKKMNIKILLI
jgi:hypothetical protein